MENQFGSRLKIFGKISKYENQNGGKNERKNTLTHFDINDKLHSK